MANRLIRAAMCTEKRRKTMIKIMMTFGHELFACRLFSPLADLFILHAGRSNVTSETLPSASEPFAF